MSEPQLLTLAVVDEMLAAARARLAAILEQRGPQDADYLVFAPVIALIDRDLAGDRIVEPGDVTAA